MNKKDDKIQIIRDLFIPWILEDYDQEGISKAWSSGETIEDFALGVAGLIPVQHIKNWDDVKHHWDNDLKDDGYIESVPRTLRVEWVNEESDLTNRGEK